MVIHDYAALSKLVELVDSATSRRQLAAEPALVADIKRLCKASDDNVRIAFDLLYDRLRQPHSQVRLLALLLCGELFQRSRIFRALLSAKFTHFLELTVGFKLDAPLPPPAEAATALRELALEFVERWNTEHGARYRQVAFGYAYLKDTLSFQFPEIDARRAAAEAEEVARQARAQTLFQERYARLLEEWPQQVAECRSMLQQMEVALSILEDDEARLRQDVAEGEEEAWEDVDPAQATEREAEGLAAYAADADLHAGGSSGREDGSGDRAAETAARNSDAVVETLAGLHRLLTSRALPAVQAALRTLVRAEVGGPGDPGHAQRERLLRSATELKAELTAAEQRYVAAQLDLTALVQAQQRRLEEQREAELMGALFGPDSDTDEAAAGARARPRGSQRGAAEAQPLPVGTSRSGRLPEHVRKALVAQAPLLPAGPYIHAWDSGEAPLYVNSTALEVSNHWGPVDVHQQLPAERMDELFMVSTSTLAPPPPQQQQQQRSVPPGRAPGNRSVPARDNGAGLAGPVALPLEVGGTDARAQRTAERAYNEAVIGCANSDEQLARALRDAEAGGGSASKKKLGASKPPVKDRLRKKLLTVQAMAAALHDAAHAEREQRREKFSNRWDDK